MLCLIRFPILILFLKISLYKRLRCNFRKY